MSVKKYVSDVVIPKEWIEEIDKCDNTIDQFILSRQRNEFIKKYYGVKKIVDMANVLGITERCIYKKIKKLRELNEIE